MKILHLEDYDAEKGKDFAKSLADILAKLNIKSYNIESYFELKALNPLEFQAIVLDGQFPEKKGGKPSVDSFNKSINFILSKGFDKEKILVWSNSTRVHAFCYENGLEYFSKKAMNTLNYEEKGVNQFAIATKATEEDIAKRIELMK